MNVPDVNKAWDDSFLEDKTLAGIGPFDAALSPEIKYRILKEVRINPFYFYSQCTRPSHDKETSNVRF